MTASDIRTFKASTKLAVLLAIGFLATPAMAGPNAGASLVLHVAEPTAVDPCYGTRRIPGCNELVTQVLGPARVYVYVLVERSSTVAGGSGAHFGIHYEPAVGVGVDVLGWQSCADTQVGVGWPASGSGLTINWTPENCQRRLSGSGDPFFDGGVAVVGYFYCSAEPIGQLVLTPHPSDGAASVIDCTGTIDSFLGVPLRLGVAGFGGAPGYNPCATPHLNPCSIDGPSTVTAGSTGHRYHASAPGGASEWTIEGSGTIVGPSDQSTVTVDAGGPGTFTLHHIGRGPVEAYVCQTTVTVTDATSIQPGTWSRIKALAGRDGS